MQSAYLQQHVGPGDFIPRGLGVSTVVGESLGGGGGGGLRRNGEQILRFDDVGMVQLEGTVHCGVAVELELRGLIAQGW